MSIFDLLATVRCLFNELIRMDMLVALVLVDIYEIDSKMSLRLNLVEKLGCKWILIIKSKFLINNTIGKVINQLNNSIN